MHALPRRRKRGMTEQWRPIAGYEGFYEVSDRGRVRSLDTPPNPFRGGQTDRTWTNSGGDMTGDLEHRKCGLIVSRSQRRAHRDAVQNNTLQRTAG
jgi:hypothetical protein